MKKSPAIFSLISSAWLLCVLFYNPRLIALCFGSGPFAAKLFLILFTIILDFFWFYLFFHAIIILFSYFHSAKEFSKLSKTSVPNSLPLVALLYTTCNDFQEQAINSHLGQDYPSYHVFILDDSTEAYYQKKIDKAALYHSDKISVIRRNNRNGFKAGNLNHALKVIGNQYSYFSVSDSDTILPPNYISALLPYVTDPQIAYAQSAQISNPGQVSLFARCMGINTDIHFNHYAVTKNKYGFVMWYGHGALMRRDIWESLGGFPEIVTEDLAYSMEIRAAGFEGVFVPAVKCYEDFPPTYQQYRKRSEKWIRGTTECLLKYFPIFFRCRHIPWFEKFDVLVSALSLLSSLPFLFLLLLSGIALPLFFPQFEFLGPMFRLPAALDIPLFSIAGKLRFNIFWTWDLFFLFLASIIVPLLPAFFDYWQHSKRIIRYLAVYIFCYFSMQAASAFHLLTVLFTGKAVFSVTGDNLCHSLIDRSEERKYDWAMRSHANQRGIFLSEIVLGMLFLCISLATHNPWFLPLGWALFVSPMLFKWNLYPLMIRYAVSLPLLMMAAIVYFIGKNLLGFLKT